MYLRHSERTEYNVVSFNKTKRVHVKVLSFILKVSFFFLCVCGNSCFFYDMMMMVEGSSFLFVLNVFNLQN